MGYSFCKKKVVFFSFLALLGLAATGYGLYQNYKEKKA